MMQYLLKTGMHNLQHVGHMQLMSHEYAAYQNLLTKQKNFKNKVKFLKINTFES